MGRGGSGQGVGGGVCWGVRSVGGVGFGGGGQGGCERRIKVFFLGGGGGLGASDGGVRVDVNGEVKFL